jgi:cation transport ATPase
MGPAVLILALNTGAYLWINGVSIDEALLRALTVVLITCPCALGIATPLAKVAAVWAARTLGVVVRDSSAIERLAEVDVFIFDKTGTVTEGCFSLRSTLALGISEREALALLGALEVHSAHIVAREILRQCEQTGLTITPASGFYSVAGMGIGGHIDGAPVHAGSFRWMLSMGLAIPEAIRSGLEAVERKGLTHVLLSRAGTVCGLFAFGDAIRADAPALRERFRTLGIRTHLVSGDSLSVTQRVASALAFDVTAAQALPEDKVAHVEHLQAQGLTVAMLGDGINDGAALAVADIGLAFGDAAGLLHEAADMTILSGGLRSVSRVFDLCRLCTRIIRQNLFAAFFYNLLGIPLAMGGCLNPLMAVLAMLASSLTVMANTLRIKREYS